MSWEVITKLQRQEETSGLRKNFIHVGMPIGCFRRMLGRAASPFGAVHQCHQENMETHGCTEATQTSRIRSLRGRPGYLWFFKALQMILKCSHCWGFLDESLFVASLYVCVRACTRAHVCTQMCKTMKNFCCPVIKFFISKYLLSKSWVIPIYSFKYY